jgi:hypothetical protein
MRRLTKLLHCSRIEWLALFEAAFWLCISGLAIRILPFRWIAALLRRPEKATPPIAEAEQQRAIDLITWSVAAVSNNLLKVCKCLPQSLAGKMMLRRRGMEGIIYLGVMKNDQRDLAAHAWLKSGMRTLIGGPDNSRFLIVSTFGSRDS